MSKKKYCKRTLLRFYLITMLFQVNLKIYVYLNKIKCCQTVFGCNALSLSSGDKYYQYEFKHQPSHGECIQMSRASPSVLFTQYTDLLCDQTLEDFFTDLFGSSCKAPPWKFCTRLSNVTLFSEMFFFFLILLHSPSVSSDSVRPQFISRDWLGVRPPVDAAMVGKVYLSSSPTASPPPARRRSNRRRRPSKRRGWHQRRQSRDVFDDLWLHEWFDLSDDYSGVTDETTAQDYSPFQNVYFFIRGTDMSFPHCCSGLNHF